MQFPLQAQEEFWKQMVADWAAALPRPNPTVPALSQLAIKLGGTILISHSQSGIYPFQTAALNTQGIAAIVSIEPGGCPTGDLKPYINIPTLVLFGDYVDLSPRWAPRLKQCRAYAEQMKKLGGKTELVVLPGDRHQGQLAHADAGQEQPRARRLAGRLAEQARRDEEIEFLPI